MSAIKTPYTIKEDNYISIITLNFTSVLTDTKLHRKPGKK